MKSWMTFACTTLLLVGSQGVVASAPGATQKAAYPCDVIDMSFCFTKPRSSVVTSWSGPDFQVYNVATRDEEALFSVYDGMAPDQGDGRVRLKQYKRDGFRVDIGTLKEADGNKTVDILIQSPRGGYLHLFGASDQNARNALADAMTNFRSCTRRGVTSVECETKSIFGASAELVRNLK